MEMLVFATKVQHAVREALGEEYRVELKEVRKNNGVILQGLVIRRGEDNIMPTIYLNSFLAAYEQGITFADIIRKIVSVYRDDAVGKEIDISFFCDFEKVKDRICFRLVNKAKNKELLEKAPFIPILDLAACFYYACEEGGVINGVIPVYHSHLEVWGVTDRELFECAVKNTPKLFPCEIMPMKSALREMLQELEEMGGGYRREAGSDHPHDDPDQLQEDIRSLLHYVSEGAGAAGRKCRRRLLSDPQFGT